VEDEDQLILATVDENPANDEEDEEVLATVVHFIMVHYKDKERIKKKKKKKYKPKAGQYQLEAGIKRFGERGETAVTRGSSTSLPPNIFGGAGDLLFPKRRKHPKNRQTPNKERPFFHHDENRPPHCHEFTIDLQRRWSINGKIGDRQGM